MNFRKPGIRHCIFGSVVLTITLTCGSLAVQDLPKQALSMRHHQIERQRVTLADDVFAFVGYSSSNFGVIKTDHGYLLIDTCNDKNYLMQSVLEMHSSSGK